MDQQLHTFTMEIWFDNFPNAQRLGTVTIKATTAEQAIAKAIDYTHYMISGVDDKHWYVSQPQTEYMGMS